MLRRVYYIVDIHDIHTVSLNVKVSMRSLMAEQCFLYYSLYHIIICADSKNKEITGTRNTPQKHSVNKRQKL